MEMMQTTRRARTIAVHIVIALLALGLAGCGGDDTSSDDDALGESSVADQADIGADDSASAGGDDSDVGGNATATLTVAGEVYTWTNDQMNVCSTDGIFPANGDFGVPPSQGGEGPWVQFIDRGDGGINFSAVLEGEEYSGTGSGEADEILSDGFTYTGMMGSGGERFEVELEVSC